MAPTIITAVYDIGRERIDGRSIQDYKNFIVNTLQAIHEPFVVYLDPKLGWKQELLKIRTSITVIEIPLTELHMYKYKDRVVSILQSPEFKHRISHPNDITNKLPEYSILQYNKLFFVEDAIQRNVYQSRQFVWMDAGFSRFFPNKTAVYTLKPMSENTFHVQAYFTKPLLESITYNNYIGTNYRIFQGGLWMASPAEFALAKAEIMRVWENEMMAKQRIDNEQIAMVYAYKQNPALFTVHLQMNSMTHLFNTMFQERVPPTTDKATVVTSYYRIPSKHSHTHYEEWIANFMLLTMNVIIYVDAESHNFLRSRYPESQKRKYKVREFKDFKTSKYNWEKEVAKNTKPHPGHNARLFQLWAEKFYFVEEAIDWNPYNTVCFVWMDIGCVRSADCIPRMTGFPDVSKINTQRVSFLQIEPWLPTDAEQAKTLTDAQFLKRNPLGGTLFAGGAQALRAFIPVYTEVLEEADRLGVFKGEDQYLYAFCALRRPDLVCLIKPPNTDYDTWFSLQIVWSAKPPLRIILVGPGIMPIPPTGWGACEILIWDMAKTLRKQGHDITILNTKDMAAVTSDIMDRKPDFVHIQYDDYAYIAGFIAPYTKGVAITSHYGYLDQKQRWGGYMDTFRLAIGHTEPNIYHFALSESIKNVYLEHGVNPARVYVVPNGADDTLFRYTSSPKYPERSIVVGKMEVRKGQYKLMNVENVWFAGNRGDGSFDYRHPRWLNEWSKPVLYDSLTDYGNLILLSDGEADPLVVKEAFTAGLGVVVSGWASANLDTTKPFITVIPNNRLNDISYIAEQIAENRRIATTMRDTIREYSRQFAWPRLMEDYTKRIYSLMEK